MGLILGFENIKGAVIIILLMGMVYNLITLTLRGSEMSSIEGIIRIAISVIFCVIINLI